MTYVLVMIGLLEVAEHRSSVLQQHYTCDCMCVFATRKAKWLVRVTVLPATAEFYLHLVGANVKSWIEVSAMNVSSVSSAGQTAF